MAPTELDFCSHLLSYYVWLFTISAIGLYNIFQWNPHVYQALSPYYMYNFFNKTQKRGWMSLGGILLCITGSEAMFADLGHFSQLSIKIAFTTFVYPSLILAYMGQAAYLSRHHMRADDYDVGFYVSVPDRIKFPVVVIAILAAVVGSQAIITGTFSIINQCSSLGCFPRVKVVHTSTSIHGQIYIPEINWILMILYLAVTIGFRDTRRLGNASGLAVITVMLVTTCLMSVVMVLCWHQSIFRAICFVFFFGTIEALYFAASLIKFLEGAWVPIALSLFFMIVMYIWHFGTLKKYEFDLQNKVSVDWLLSLGPNLGIVRVRGVGLIHTELVSGIPAIFSHFVTNLPDFHQVLVFLCVKSVPVPHVEHEERFLLGHVGPREYRVYRCIVRYGYRDVHKDDMEFEKDLFCSIAEFIRTQKSNTNGTDEPSANDNEKMMVVRTPQNLLSQNPLTKVSIYTTKSTKVKNPTSTTAPPSKSPFSPNPPPFSTAFATVRNLNLLSQNPLTKVPIYTTKSTKVKNPNPNDLYYRFRYKNDNSRWKFKPKTAASTTAPPSKSPFSPNPPPFSTAFDTVIQSKKWFVLYNALMISAGLVTVGHSFWSYVDFQDTKKIEESGWDAKSLMLHLGFEMEKMYEIYMGYKKEGRENVIKLMKSLDDLEGQIKKMAARGGGDASKSAGAGV